MRGLWDLCLTLHKPEEAYTVWGRKPAWIGDLVLLQDDAASLVGCEPTYVAVSPRERSGRDLAERLPGAPPLGGRDSVLGRGLRSASGESRRCEDSCPCLDTS